MPSAASNTVYGIVEDAMRDAGLLRKGQLPDSQSIADNTRILCDIINLWQTQGLKLFLMQEITVPLVAGQGMYTLGPVGDVVMARPMGILQGFVLGPGNIRRPIIPLSWQEWMTLSQVTGNDGMISSYFEDKQATQTNMHFWNTPDSTEALNTVVLLARTQAPNPVNLTDDVSFPPEWRIALRWGLADEICTGQPDTIMNRCSRKANAYRTALEDFDVENAPTYFTVDQRTIAGRKFV